MDEWIMERYTLAKERIREMKEETEVKPPFLDFFQRTADFLQKTVDLIETDIRKTELSELEKRNRELYQELFPENYSTSYGNPSYAAEKLGEYGPVFTFLYGELRGAIPYAYEKKWWDLLVSMELFLEIYGEFCAEELPEVKTVQDILSSYVNDYCQDMVEQRILEGIDPEQDFANLSQTIPY